MKTIKELEAEDTCHEDSYFKAGQLQAYEDVLKLINKIQNRASKKRKNSEDKKYWLGCCQILNELKKRITGK